MPSSCTQNITELNRMLWPSGYVLLHECIRSKCCVRHRNKLTSRWQARNSIVSVYLCSILKSFCSFFFLGATNKFMEAATETFVDGVSFRKAAKQFPLLYMTLYFYLNGVLKCFLRERERFTQCCAPKFRETKLCISKIRSECCRNLRNILEQLYMLCRNLTARTIG
jgi:hypothetical protein